MIFANHAHIFPQELRKEGTVPVLLEYLAECEIDKAVAFAPFQMRLDEAAFGKEANGWLEKQLGGDGRLVGFGTVDFRKDNVADQVRNIKELGFKGIKVHPAYQEVSVVGEKAFELYAEAEKSGLFLSFHTGIHWHRIKDYAPVLFDEVAYCFPELKFSMEHIGGYSFFNEALAVMCNNSRKGNNVYAGWTSIAFDENGLAGIWSISDEQLLTLLNQTGYENSIFGLDFPYKNVKMTKDAIQRIKSLPISEEAKAAILGDNLARALNI